jgi:heme-degrading monooxygenase HmoA
MEVGMHARVSAYEGSDGDALIDGFKGVSDELEGIDGFSHAYFLVDRASGKGMSITFWESEDALNASVARADDLRMRGTQSSHATTRSVEHYDVAFAVGSALR